MRAGTGIALAAFTAACTFFLAGCGGILPEDVYSLFHKENTKEICRLNFADYADWTADDWSAADSLDRWKAVKAMLEATDPQAFEGVHSGVLVQTLNDRIDKTVRQADGFFAGDGSQRTMQQFADETSTTT